MIHVSDEQLHQAVQEAVAAIPAQFADHLNNVGFMVEDEASPEQLAAGGGARAGMMLLGLYQGIPLPQRTNGYSGVLPDIITIFKRPHEMLAHDLVGLHKQVHQTVWHEVAHYFGLNHDQIRALEE